MTRVAEINTPENVSIEYELAGIGSRGLAAIVDAAAIVLALLPVALVAWVLTYYGLVSISRLFWSLLVVCALLVSSGYYVLFESIWNGQTPGKRVVGIRTVKDGGTPIDVVAATVRNLVRSVDSLPSMYAVGILSVLFSRTNKRLGDYAAGTIVVKERPRDIGAAEHNWVLVKSPAEGIDVSGHGTSDTGFDVYLVRPEEFEAAKSYCDRRYELADDARKSIAARIAEPIMVRLGISADYTTDYDLFLEELCTRCAQERGMR